VEQTNRSKRDDQRQSCRSFGRARRCAAAAF
jgi:hypothetical protein